MCLYIEGSIGKGGSEQLIWSMWPRKERFPVIMLLHVWRTKHHHIVENPDFNILYSENLKQIMWCYFVSHPMKFICSSTDNVAD
jgi:hypothetical protein